MTIKRRRGVLGTGLMGQLEFTVECDYCSTTSGWQHDCGKVIEDTQSAGWTLPDSDYYADLCPKCAEEESNGTFE